MQGDGKYVQKSLGYFETAKGAALAYQRAKRAKLEAKAVAKGTGSGSEDTVVFGSSGTRLPDIPQAIAHAVFPNGVATAPAGSVAPVAPRAPSVAPPTHALAQPPASAATTSESLSHGLVPTAEFVPASDSMEGLPEAVALEYGE